VKLEREVVDVMPGPCVWWARNDLRIQDNPILRDVIGSAFCDGRDFVAVFVFDPRFLDRSQFGRVTDPDFKKSISNRKPVTFSSRKTNALRARFWRQCVLELGKQLAARGSKLLVCYGKPEEVLGGLPTGSMVKCQSEIVSIEQTDVEDFCEARLLEKESHLHRDPGAMSLYHPDDLPFGLKERPDSYSGLGSVLGWRDIWTSAERHDWATTIRPPVQAPSVFPPAPADLQLPGLIPADVLADESKMLQLLGYTSEEIREAQAQEIPIGGEPAAQSLLEQWVAEQNRAKRASETETHEKMVYWDLPCGGQSGSGEAHDPMQWKTLAKTTGWLRVSHYMAVGCVSARQIFHTASEMPTFAGVAHRLLWRDFHRLYAIKYHREICWLQGPAKVQRPWSQDPDIAEAWKSGHTGVPYIDACQRELKQTGWLAYKGRKTAAHFLVHDLGMDWRIGAFHDEEVLFDYDFAMNYGNWAVVAKIGNGGSSAWNGSQDVDPEHLDLKWKLRAEQENDPSGAYIRRWVPELQNVDDEYVHTPWLMSEEEMEACGCIIGRDYPASIVGPLDLPSIDECEVEVEDAPRDILLGVTLPEDEPQPEVLQGLPDKAFALMLANGRQGSVWGNGEHIIAHFLDAPENMVVYHDDPQWEDLPAVGSAVKSVCRGYEECFTVAICPSANVWSVGISMNVVNRYAAANVALGAALAVQTLDKGLDLDISGFPWFSDLMSQVCSSVHKADESENKQLTDAGSGDAVVAA